MFRIVSFHPCIDAHVQVVLGSRRLNGQDLDLIRQADAVILPQARVEDFKWAILTIPTRFFPNYHMRFKYPGKIGQNQLFEKFGCAHPKTLPWPNLKRFHAAFRLQSDWPHGFPFMVKDDKSHEAEGVFWVENGADLDEAGAFLSKKEDSGLYGFVTQDYVPTGGNVLRVVIMGDKVLGYWKRPSRPDGIITTVTKGAVIDHEWRPLLIEKGKTAAKWLAEKTGINLAAIDFLFPVLQKDPAPLFLEINYYFGRKGLGGSERYYALLYKAVQEWLRHEGLDETAIKLI